MTDQAQVAVNRLRNFFHTEALYKPVPPPKTRDMQIVIEAYEKLKEEVEGLRKDAERYRWLRSECENPIGGLTICEVGSFGLEPWSGDDPDHYIDAMLEADR